MPQEPRIEDSLAELIAELWKDISDKAEAEKNAENQKDEDLLLEWAKKLASILKGPPK